MQQIIIYALNSLTSIMLLWLMVENNKIVFDDKIVMFHGLLAMRLVLFINVALGGVDNVLDWLGIS